MNAFRLRFRPQAGALLCLLGLVVFPAVPQPASAQSVRIAFVDSERIFQEYKLTKQAQADFNRELEELGARIDERRRELEKMVEEYESQSLILSEPRRREREAEIQEMRSEYDKMIREIWGPGGQVAQRNEDLTRPIIEKMNQVLLRIGEEEGFSIIFDAADGNIVYADQALDLTDRVLEELNREE